MDQYDLVLLNRRVRDLETGRDLVGNVGIANGKIVAIEAERLIGKEILDVSALVVAPGFIFREELDSQISQV